MFVLIAATEKPLAKAWKKQSSADEEELGPVSSKSIRLVQ